MGMCVFERDYLMNPLIVQEATLTMRKEIQDLRTNARIFQLSKCTACTFTLDLPAVHFMCIHSFHQRCLGDNEKECPVCAPEYRSVLEMKTSLEQNSKDQDRFFQQVKSSKDGFSVIAEYFGKGVISKTSNGPTGASSWSAAVVLAMAYEVLLAVVQVSQSSTVLSMLDGNCRDMGWNWADFGLPSFSIGRPGFTVLAFVPKVLEVVISVCSFADQNDTS